MRSRAILWMVGLGLCVIVGCGQALPAGNLRPSGFSVQQAPVERRMLRLPPTPTTVLPAKQAPAGSAGFEPNFCAAKYNWCRRFTGHKTCWRLYMKCIDDFMGEPSMGEPLTRK